MKPEGRSRVTNLKTLFVTGDGLEGVDGRSAIARRFRDLLAGFLADLGGPPTEAQIALARRAAALATHCEAQEAAMAAGQPLDVATFTTAANSLKRHLEALGIERRLKDVTPSIDAYLAGRKTP